MSGRHSRNKGAGYERELVNAFKGAGLVSRRVPLSGATSYAKNDVEVDAGFAPGVTYSGECKRRESLPVIFKEIEGADFLAVRADHGETYIVMRLPMFVDLLQ